MIGGAHDTTEDDSRDNYADILEELDPLPELPEAVDDRFFSKEELDFQYTTGPAENPLFPTWGSTGAEMAAIGAAEAAKAGERAAAHSTTPPPLATLSPPPAPVAAASPVPSYRTKAIPSLASGGGGGGRKRTLQEVSQHQAERGVTAAAAAAYTTGDRTVFLRQRLGGESVSSGNSSTSAGSGSGSGCSDNGSASDEVAGEWEGGAKGHGDRTRNRHGSVRRSKKPFLQGAGVAVTTAAASVSSASAASGLSLAGSSTIDTLQAPTKAALRTRFGGLPTCSRGRHKRSGRGGGHASDGSSGSASGCSTTGSVSSSVDSNIGVGAYASWDTLVKPFKQQWDHVEGPAAVPWSTTSTAAAGASKSTYSPRLSGTVCSVFSTEPRPNSTTAFSVEQCSAKAHPAAVASYVLRVRCAGGAHIVRRTWDDIVRLCNMLGPELARSATSAAGITSNGGGGGSGAGKGAAGAAVEFTPADVLAPDAASGFFNDLLARPGMAWAMPTRRFLELEYLDGTLRGGVADDSRATAARQVASLAAFTTAAAAAAQANATATAVVVENNVAATAPRAEAPDTTTSGDSREGERAESPARVLRSTGQQPRSSVGVPRPAQSLPAHPDAARDLAAVCRCLGELGASAFTITSPSAPSSVPLAFRGAAPYWSAKDEGKVGASGGKGVASQRGFALLA